MLSAIAAAALMSVAYKIPATPVVYRLNATFEGYLPILGGQENANVNAILDFSVKGLEKDSEGADRAESDVTFAEIRMAGALLPFDVDSIKGFFPKNTISYSPIGKVLKNDAPDLALPIRLPGLDVKRVPDIVYVPIEFPEGGIEVGKPFNFKKRFIDSDISYEVTPSKLEGNTLTMDLKMSQTYESFEDEAKNVAKEQDAVAKLKTDVSGKGTVLFDVQRGLVTRSEVTADATTIATNIKSGERATRKMTTSLIVELKKK